MRDKILNKSLLIAAVFALVLPLARVSDAEDKGGQKAPSKVKELATEQDIFEELLRNAKEFEGRAEQYMNYIDGSVELKHEANKEQVSKDYDERIKKLERRDQMMTMEVINKLEAFIAKYPYDLKYAPELIFRLSDVYFGQALNKNSEGASMQYLAETDPDPIKAKDYAVKADDLFAGAERLYKRSRDLAQKIIDEYPTYAKRDLAYLAVARVCGNLQDYKCIQKALHELVEQYPKSEKVPVALYRLGVLYYDQYNNLELPQGDKRFEKVKQTLIADAKLWAQLEGKNDQEKASIEKEELATVDKELKEMTAKPIDNKRFGTVMARHYFMVASNLPLDVWPTKVDYATKTLYLLAIAEFAMPNHDWRAAYCMQKFMEFYEQSSAEDPKAWAGIKERMLQAQEIFAYIYTTIYVASDKEVEDGSASAKLRKHFESIGPKKWQRGVYLKFIAAMTLDRKYKDVIDSYRALIDLDPKNPENPELHYKVILYYNDYICGKKESAEICRDFIDREREAMTKNYGSGSEWYKANQDNPTVLNNAFNKLKGVTYAYGNDHYNRGIQFMQDNKMDDAKKEFAKAAEVYKSFLLQYPNDTEAYDTNMQLADALYYSGKFDEAIVEYKAVYDSQLNIYYKGNAALFIYLAYDKLVDAAGLQQIEAASVDLTADEKLKRERVNKDDLADGYKVVKKEMPDLRKKYIEAANNYMNWLDKDVPATIMAAKKKMSETKDQDTKDALAELINSIETKITNKENKLSMLSNLAFYYLVYRDYDSSKAYYKKVIDLYPGTLQALDGHRKIVYMLSAEENIKDLFVAVDDTLAYIGKYKGKFPQEEETVAKEVQNIKAKASFDLAMNYKDVSKFENAAKQFEDFAEKYKENENAPTALYNAAAMYKQAKLFSSAANIYRRFVDRYPDHPETPAIRLNLALTAYQGFELKDAEDQFTKLYQTKNSNIYYKCMSLYFRSQLWEYDHRYKEAAQGYEEYSISCASIPEKDIPEAFAKELQPYNPAETLYKAFEVHKKNSDLPGMERTLGSFEKKHGNDPKYSFMLIQGYYSLTEEYDKRGAAKKRDEYYDKIVKYFHQRAEFKDVASSNDAKLAHKFAAKADFTRLEKLFENFMKMRLSCKGADVKTLDQRLRKEMTAEINRELKAAPNAKAKKKIMSSLEAKIDSDICKESIDAMLDAGKDLADGYKKIAGSYVASYAVVAKYRMGAIFEMIADQVTEVAAGDLPKHIAEYIKSLNDNIAELNKTIDEFNNLMLQNPDPAFGEKMQANVDMIMKVIEQVSAQAQQIESSFRDPRQKDAAEFYATAAKFYQECFALLGIFGTDVEMTIWRERIKEAMAKPSIRKNLSGDLRLLRRDARPSSYEIGDIIQLSFDNGEAEKVKPKQSVDIDLTGGALPPPPPPDKDKDKAKDGSDAKTDGSKQGDK